MKKTIKQIIIILLIFILFGCSTTSNNVDNDEQIIEDETTKEISNVLDIPNSELIIDEEGRELLVIDLNLDNVKLLRKHKEFENKYIDENFGDEITEVVSGYYCPLYDLGWTLVKCIGFHMRIDNDMVSSETPSVMWGKAEFNIEKIKGKLVFCKLDDYGSFDFCEDKYYFCDDDGNIIRSVIVGIDDNFPY